jgi:hypothetical protein
MQIIQKTVVSSKDKCLPRCLRFERHGWLSLLAHFFQRRCWLFFIISRSCFLVLAVFHRSSLHTITSTKLHTWHHTGRGKAMGKRWIVFCFLQERSISLNTVQQESVARVLQKLSHHVFHTLVHTCWPRAIPFPEYREVACGHWAMRAKINAPIWNNHEQIFVRWLESFHNLIISHGHFQ